MAFRTFFSYDFEENTTFSTDINIEEPRQCMHCDQTGVQNFITGMMTNGKNDEYHCIGLYTCTLCESTTTHHFVVWDYNLDNQKYVSVRTFPTKIQEIKGINDNLQKMFSEFAKVFKQAKEAEEAQLDQIAGMGYRKSLEFLVIDYLKAYPVEGVTDQWLENPKISLSQKISKIKSDRMQVLARAASFLGNDETHYTRRHPEHDIDSIKAFIGALLAEIQNEIEYNKALELINKTKS